MRERTGPAVTAGRGGAGGRAPVLLLLLALVALFAGLCHGTPAHAAPASGPVGHAATGAAVAVASPVHGPVPHGCGEGGEGHVVDLPVSAATAAAPQLDPPGPSAAADAGDTPPPPGAVPPGGRTRAGPRPAPGRLLIALGVDRN
ncbi:hypothetical protein ACIQRS_30345 [Streptomyces termitum]|uniref:Uncharacterized protein n=1 Tax=Streptomyces termitum TaxID=67368 RepID=A0A918T8W1_9ACTN|nr:hypothetical protein [Streptomyces termitum]GHB05831.1 hypothetical protein GCM10010305_56260 [Streptomyces termitum]